MVNIPAVLFLLCSPPCFHLRQAGAKISGVKKEREREREKKSSKFEAPPNLHFARTAYLKHDASILVTHMSLSFYTQFTICYSLGIHSTFSHDIKDKWKSWKRRGRTPRDGAARTGHWRSVLKHIKGNQDAGGKTSAWLVLPLSPCLQFP